MSQTRFINPTTLGMPPGYTHVVEVTAPARIVYIAGQLGIDKEGKLSSDFRQQAVQSFENLKNALAAVGGQFHHVVKLNNYFVDMKYLPIFRHVKSAASTTVAISGLAREEALIEVGAIAVLPAAEQTSPARKEVARQGRSNRAPKGTSRPRRR